MTQSNQDLDAMRYQMLFALASEQDNKIWQTPVVAFTAQAFLLTVALQRDSAPLARCISSALSALISLVCMQLMQKHRFLTKLDMEEAGRIESANGWPSLSTRRIGEPGVTAGTWIQRRSSYKTWMLGLGTFCVVSVAIFVIALVHSSWLT